MNRRGFTLLELIMVIVVLSTLISMAMPQYESFVERARTAEAMSAIETIKTAEQACYLSSGNFKLTNDANLDADLGVHLDRAYWTYDVNNTMLAAPPGYVLHIGITKYACIKATRTTGPFAGKYIYLIIYDETIPATYWTGNHPERPRN